MINAPRTPLLALAAWLVLGTATAYSGEEDPAPETTGSIARSAAGAPAVADRSLIVYMHQTASVRSNCFTPELRSLLDELRTALKTPLIVTSGYRGKQRARRGSYHRRCMAADVQVKGVSPGRVARVARSLQGIGGVGTYCHTRSVHVDVGPRRDWHWSCRRRR